ncbi:MAG: helix-turn-helix domain-containing protein [Bacteroidales bacterium]|nr:helix-turn-helix domain-containing protein [Bacteroidales bacterium]
MDRLSINNIQKLNELQNELEHERAVSLFLKMRTLEQEDSSYTPIRKHLKKLILQYEQEHWPDEDHVTDRQIEESDMAETWIQAENEFYWRRKTLIKRELKNAGLNQNDLARILGHRKGYTSELINGLRPFSKEDLVIVNRLFKIKLEDLIPPFINQEKARHIKNTLESLSNCSVKSLKHDFDW